MLNPMPLTIPTTNVEPTLFEPSTIALYGDPKLGKSETIAKLNEAQPGNLLHIDTHEAIRHLRTRRVAINSLAEWLELITTPPGKTRSPLQEAWHAAPFQFICVDVLDDVEEWALQQAEANYRRMPVGKNFGGVSILELDRGLGYGYLRDAFFKIIEPVWGRPAWTTIFLVHSKAKYLDNIIQDAQSDQLDLTGRVRKMICNKVDCVGRWFKDANGKLQITFATKEKVIGPRFRYLHNAVVQFSDPAKPEEWAKIWPTTWNKKATVPGAPATPIPAQPISVTNTKP